MSQPPPPSKTNTYLGEYSGNFNSQLNTGLINSSFGYYSNSVVEVASANGAFGAYALQNNSTGLYNTAIGTSALYNLNPTGSGATGLPGVPIGFANTALGCLAGQNDFFGSCNTYLGCQSGPLQGELTTYIQSTAIGYDARLYPEYGTSAPTDPSIKYNQVVIGVTGTQVVIPGSLIVLGELSSSGATGPTGPQGSFNSSDSISCSSLTSQNDITSTAGNIIVGGGGGNYIGGNGTDMLFLGNYIRPNIASTSSTVTVQGNLTVDETLYGSTIQTAGSVETNNIGTFSGSTVTVDACLNIVGDLTVVESINYVQMLGPNGSILPSYSTSFQGPNTISIPAPAIGFYELYAIANQTSGLFITFWFNGTEASFSNGGIDTGGDLSFVLGNGVLNLSYSGSGTCYVNLNLKISN